MENDNTLSSVTNTATPISLELFLTSVFQELNQKREDKLRPLDESSITSVSSDFLWGYYKTVADAVDIINNNYIQVRSVPASTSSTDSSDATTPSDTSDNTPVVPVDSADTDSSPAVNCS